MSEEKKSAPVPVDGGEKIGAPSPCCDAKTWSVPDYDRKDSIAIKDAITHQDISYTAALKERFGIDLPFTDKIALTPDSRNPFEQILDYIIPSAAGATMNEYGVQNLNLAFNRPLTSSDKITLYLSGSSNVGAGDLRLIVGGQNIGIAGPVTIDALEGQNFLAMTLLETGDIHADASATIRAYLESEGSQLNLFERIKCEAANDAEERIAA